MMRAYEFENGEIVVADSEEKARAIHYVSWRDIADIVNQLRIEKEAQDLGRY